MYNSCYTWLVLNMIITQQQIFSILLTSLKWFLLLIVTVHREVCVCEGERELKQERGKWRKSSKAFTFWLIESLPCNFDISFESWYNAPQNVCLSVIILLAKILFHPALPALKSVDPAVKVAHHFVIQEIQGHKLREIIQTRGACIKGLPGVHYWNWIVKKNTTFIKTRQNRTSKTKSSHINL